MNRSVSWTIHLNGIASIFEQQRLFTYSDGRIKRYTAFVGILNLPIHTLGRKTKARGIWYHHCRFQHGIDSVTGLPYSLIDLLSAIHQPDVAQLLSDWILRQGAVTQQQVWEATRQAALIIVLRLHQPDKLGCTHFQRLLNLLHDLSAEMSNHSSQARQALLFPLFIAGSGPLTVTEFDKTFIVERITQLVDGSLETCPCYNGAVGILAEVGKHGNERSLEQVAQDLGLEQSLF